MKPNMKYANISELYAAKRALATARTACTAPIVWVMLGCIVFSFGAVVGAVLCH